MSSKSIVSSGQKERNPMVDIISGLFILVIIIQHLLQNTGLYEGSFFNEYVIRYLIVFMPWFYFKAGLLYKEPENIKKAISLRTKKLLYPFIVWSIIPSLLILPFYVVNHDAFNWFRTICASLFYGEGPFNTPLWFLPSLLLVYILFYTSILRDKWIYLVVLGIVSWGLSYCAKLPLGVNNLPLGCFFFLLGIKYRSINIRFHFPLWVILLCLYIIMMTFWYSPVGFRSNRLSGNSYLLYLVEASLLLFVLFQISLFKSHFVILEYIGRHSIMFYVSHAPVIIILKYYRDFFMVNITDWGLLTLMVVGITVVFSLLILLRGKLDFLFHYPRL